MNVGDKVYADENGNAINWPARPGDNHIGVCVEVRDRTCVMVVSGETKYAGTYEVNRMIPKKHKEYSAGDDSRWDEL